MAWCFGRPPGHLQTTSAAHCLPLPLTRVPAGLQLPGLMNSLDFLNVMTYDYHGGWERQVNFLHSWNDTLVRVGRGAGG